jgi:hypothetical protein
MLPIGSIPEIMKRQTGQKMSNGVKKKLSDMIIVKGLFITLFNA